MRPGQVIADRFEVERLAGWGGMAAVYRARDRLTGEPVAVKLLHGENQADAGRFGREAVVLAKLNHPGIVKYVAHGVTPDGQHYLAMEWLEGEDLAERLAGPGLSVEETVVLALRVAEALAIAHAHGVIHRDITPGNIFLPGGQIDRAKVLDFGIARLSHATRGTTRHGVVLGTLWYMSPEQAKGDQGIDARADVFALGCVMFECLVGRPPFMADDLIALLAKILLEETPRVRDLRQHVPENLDALVSRMLSKDPDGRPANGAALAREVEALGAIHGSERAPPSVRPSALTASEQRLLCVVLACPPPDRISSGAITGSAESVNATMAAVRAAVAPYGGVIEQLADGSILTTPSGTGPATDQAAKAARCALAMRAVLPDAPMALATGRALVSQPWPVGEVIERAVRLMRAVTSTALPSDAPARSPAIRLDEVTAGLLKERFDVGHDRAGLVLRGEREGADASRTLLGRPSPCVGRERELSALGALYDECVTESMARAVLVTAPAGVGKSRLRHEFLRTVAQRGEPVEIWIGRGDPMRAGSPFGMLAPAIRSTLKILDGEPIEVRRRKLEARVKRNVPAADVQRVSEFLGELLGVPFPGEESVQLRAARQDAMIMGDQMRRAWEDFVAAESAAQPVLVVLEDLHWGDLPSVKFIDAALRNLADRPLMVLALARPEVHDLFPGLWADRRLQPIPLGELSPRSAEKLVRQVLGDGVSARVVKQLVERAAGNAFYLEELVRAVADGQGEALPDTVLAMVQERLERLEGEARRVLRAASVFGQVFWRGGVHALLGGERQPGQIDRWLGELSEREMISRRAGAKFPGEEEFVFRHALVRDTAYATLTQEDLSLGHRLAGAWLDAAGESDAMTLAEHFERGGDPGRAVGAFRRAAAQALEGNDFAAAVARAERGLACGADGEVRGALRLAQAEAHKWRGEYARAEVCAIEAMERLPAGGPQWYSAAAELVMAMGRLGHYDSLEDLGRRLLAIGLDETSESSQVIAWARASLQLLHAGRSELADALLSGLGMEAGSAGERDPLVAARTLQARGHRALVGGDPGTCMELIGAAAASFERAGDLRSACLQRSNFGYSCMEVGAYARAREALQEALTAAERIGLDTVVADAKHNLGLALAMTGALDRARIVEAEACEAFRAHGAKRMEGGSRIYLAKILALSGEIEAAEREARTAVEVLATTPPIRAYALAVLAQVLLARGDVTAGLAAATESMSSIRALGGIETGESFARLVYVQALEATEQRDAARAAVLEARDSILARAAKIADASLRKGFLEQVPENARTLALAQQS